MQHASAVLRLHVVRPVCPSVCDVGGSEPHRLEILETNSTDNWPNNFALRSTKAIHLLPGEYGEIWGSLEAGWRKVTFWSFLLEHKSGNISEIRKDRGNVTIEGSHQRSFEQYHFRPLRPLPQDWGFATPTQNCNAIAIVPETGKATDFIFSRYIHRVHPAPLKISEKKERGHIQGLPKFLGYPYYRRKG